MLRFITAATALTVLVACDSEGIDRVTTIDGPVAGTVTVDNSADTGTSGATAASDNGTSDADGSTSATDTNDTSSTDNETIALGDSDASDDGQTTIISDDAGSATSDGGLVSDDAGSATSDGGQVSDDAGSSSSDGGTADTSDNSADDTATAAASQGARDTNAGDFASDATGGDVLRVSSLASNTSDELCTTLSDQNNFGDTRIGDFILHNNAWRTFRAAPGYEWEQCIYTNTNGALVGWNYDWGPGVGGSADFYVRSYPELIYGVKDEFRTSAPQSETGLPVVLSELPNIRIDYSYDGPQFGESRTVDASNNPRFPNGGIVTRNGGSNHTFEVMVWLDAGAERLPAGANDFVADLTIRGDDYKVYTKDSDPRYIAFVAQNPQTTGTIFWNDFTDWARDNSFQVRELFGARSNTVQIQDDWCVANILVGTEIFWGAGTLNIFDWTITQSR